MSFSQYPHINGEKELNHFYGKKVNISYKSDGSNFRILLGKERLDAQSIERDGFFFNFGSHHRNLSVDPNLENTWKRAIDYFFENDWPILSGALSQPNSIKSIWIVGEWLGEAKDVIRRDPSAPHRSIIYFDIVINFHDETSKWTTNDLSIFTPPLDITKQYYDSSGEHFICTPDLIKAIWEKQEPFTDLYEGVVIRPIGLTREDFISQDLWDFDGEHPIYMKIKTIEYLGKSKSKTPKTFKLPPELSEEQRSLIETVPYEDIIHSFESSFPEYNRGDMRAMKSLIPFLLESVNREILGEITDKDSKRFLSTQIVNNLKSLWTYSL